MDGIYILFSTINDLKEAEKISGALLEERLAACVNIVPGLLSIYRWKGNIERDQEYLMILKTSEAKLPQLIRRLTELHPYEVPEAVSFPIEQGHEPYLDWVRKQTE
jgi:periplasmic divalent cation tolerance protein